MSWSDEELVGARYRSVRLRLTAVLEPLSEAQWELPVAGCPGWRVRDVLAHLLGNVEDALAGRISGPPTEEQTRDQVARHVDDDPAGLVEAWTEQAPEFEAVLDAVPIWPAFIDAVSHEHDIRAAIGDRGGRTADDVFHAARLLATPPDGIEFVLDGAGEAAADGVDARLSTTSFELLRLRLGRRSEAQVLAMDWEGDPRPHLGGLFVFGPSERDQVE